MKVNIIVIVVLLSITFLISASPIIPSQETSTGDQEPSTNACHCFYWVPSNDLVSEVSVTDKSKCHEIRSEIFITFSLVFDSDSHDTNSEHKYAVNIGIDVYKEYTSAGREIGILLEPKGDFVKWRHILFRWNANNQRHDVILVSKSGTENVNGCSSSSNGISSDRKDWQTREGVIMKSTEQRCDPIQRLSGEELDLIHTPFDVCIFFEVSGGHVIDANYVITARTVAPVALIAGAEVLEPRTTTMASVTERTQIIYLTNSPTEESRETSTVEETTTTSASTVTVTGINRYGRRRRTGGEDNDWVTIAIVLGIVFFMILVLIVFFFLCKDKGMPHGHHYHPHRHHHHHGPHKSPHNSRSSHRKPHHREHRSDSKASLRSQEPTPSNSWFHKSVTKSPSHEKSTASPPALFLQALESLANPDPDVKSNASGHQSPTAHRAKSSASHHTGIHQLKSGTDIVAKSQPKSDASLWPMTRVLSVRKPTSVNPSPKRSHLKSSEVTALPAAASQRIKSHSSLKTPLLRIPSPITSRKSSSSPRVSVTKSSSPSSESIAAKRTNSRHLEPTILISRK